MSRTSAPRSRPVHALAFVSLAEIDLAGFQLGHGPLREVQSHGLDHLLHLLESLGQCHG